MRVVLVHGIYDTGRVFDALAGYLSERGAICLSPSLQPSDGRDGLEDLAAKLAAAIDTAFGHEAPFDLVGFSMGGLIARYYLQELDGFRRARQFFAISAPFAGSLWSRFSKGHGIAQMRPGSSFLAQLRRTEHVLDSIPAVSYWTPMDLVILPATSSIWTRAENVRLLAPCHPCMLWSAALMRDLAGRMGLPPEPLGPHAGSAGTLS